jgi:HJR/Mrr/RecB family endonuclease
MFVRRLVRSCPHDPQNMSIGRVFPDGIPASSVCITAGDTVGAVRWLAGAIEMSRFKQISRPFVLFATSAFETSEAHHKWREWGRKSTMIEACRDIRFWRFRAMTASGPKRTHLKKLSLITLNVAFDCRRQSKQASFPHPRELRKLFANPILKNSNPSAKLAPRSSVPGPRKSSKRPGAALSIGGSTLFGLKNIKVGQIKASVDILPTSSRYNELLIERMLATKSFGTDIYRRGGKMVQDGADSGRDFDFSNLNYQEFELLVGALLARSGLQIVDQSKSGRPGPDFEAALPNGERLIVEIKHYRHPIPPPIARQFIGDITRYRLQSPGTEGLLVISGELSVAARKSLEQPGIDIWTGSEVRRRLALFPDIAAALRKSSGALNSLQMMIAGATVQPTNTMIKQFEVKLSKIASGNDDWRKFEDWGTEILTEIFKPHLGPPDKQVRSDDGLDIMDAIFPIRAGTPPWSLVRSEYVTRFVVAEYKNYGAEIGARQVESIEQYLWKQAKRQFGLLVSRHAPSQPAIAQRRRAWLDKEKMIVFLTADDLLGMLEMRENGEEPFAVIDAQLEDFLRTLSP